MNLLNLVEFEGGYTFEAFFQVMLHPSRLLGLGKDFEQLAIGQEIEARE